MLLIKTKPSTIHIDCYTMRPDVAEYAPIKPAAAFIPDWFKDLPRPTLDKNELTIRKTMKGCYGFIKQTTTGFVMPLWSDLLLEIGEAGAANYRWRFSDNISSLDVHPQYQRGIFLPEEKYQHFKLISPWAFSTKDDLHWQCLQFPWAESKPEQYMALSGIVDFKYQTGTNINLIFPRGSEKKVVHLKHGHPIYQFVPLTEKKVNHKIQVVDQKEWEKIKSLSNCTTFVRKFFHNKKLRCPFG